MIVFAAFVAIVIFWPCHFHLTMPAAFTASALEVITKGCLTLLDNVGFRTTSHGNKARKTDHDLLTEAGGITYTHVTIGLSSILWPLHSQ